MTRRASMTPTRRPPGGFTLIEMLTTVAALVIVLGLMVSLARDVRTRSAERLTKDLLARLDQLMAQYQARNKQVPVVTPFPPTGDLARAEAEGAGAGAEAVGAAEGGVSVPPAAGPTIPALPALAPSAPAPGEPETAFQSAARRNNEDFVRALRRQEDLAAKAFAELSVAHYDEVSLRDAWGNPVVFMPTQHPDIGMAPGDRPFFVSAGPDRQFLTRADNLYSYEGPEPELPPPAPPATRE